MTGYVLRRLLQIVPALVVVSIVVFALLSLTRIDPAYAAVEKQNGGFVPPAALQAKRHQLGLDQPLPLRYARWLRGVATLDFGTSYADGDSVARLMRQHIPATGLLAGAALLLALGVSLPLGVAAALWRDIRLLDVAVRVASVVGASVPGFALALGMIWLFAAELHWLPAFGGPSARALVLPAIALAVPQSGLLVRLTRASVLDVLNEEYVAVARAKGLGGRAVARSRGRAAAYPPQRARARPHCSRTHRGRPARGCVHHRVRVRLERHGQAGGRCGGVGRHAGGARLRTVRGGGVSARQPAG